MLGSLKTEESKRGSLISLKIVKEHTTKKYEQAQRIANRAKNVALSSVESIGGIEISDLDVVGWAIPMVLLYYLVITINTVTIRLTALLDLLSY